MNSNQPDARGERASTIRSLPPVEIDCSGWAPQVPQDAGRLVSLTRSLSPVEVDCSGWGNPAVWLELVVSFDDGADVANVQALTTKLIQAAHDAAPELGLTYDPSRSRVRGEDVVVALTPRNTAGAEDRLGSVIRRVRETVVTTRELTLTSAGLRWAG